MKEQESGYDMMRQEAMDEERSNMFILPDPLVVPSMISGAVLLYFDGPFIASTPPAVVTSESFVMLDLVSSRKPHWADRIFRIADSLRAVNATAKTTWDSIKSVDPDAFKLTYLAFPANSDAYRRVDRWVGMSGYEYKDLKSIVIPPLGAAELARHIFLEKYLELGRDLEPLYKYCDDILGSDSLDSLVVASYLLRLQVLLSIPPDGRVLFTNEKLVPFFERLTAATQSEPPLQATQEDTTDCLDVDSDVVAWEFFRVLVSRIIDPIDFDRLALIARIRKENREQVLRLRARCKELASEVSNETSIVGLGDRVLTIIESRLRNDLRELFELDKTTWRDFRNSLASDRVVWASVAGLLSGLAGSGPLFTAAGIITALASVGSTAVKVRVAREAELRRNDLALLRVLKQHS